MKHQPGSYDATFSDIAMPRENGFAVFRRLTKQDPCLRVYFFTAFEVAMSEFSNVFPEMWMVRLIEKPLHLSALANSYRRR